MAGKLGRFPVKTGSLVCDLIKTVAIYLFNVHACDINKVVAAIKNFFFTELFMWGKDRNV
jgi:hypothetical protein